LVGWCRWSGSAKAQLCPSPLPPPFFPRSVPPPPPPLP
jgi:hypothetical protein